MVRHYDKRRLRRPFDDAQAGMGPSFPVPGELPHSREIPAPARTPRLPRKRREPEPDTRERFRRCAQTIADLLGIDASAALQQVTVFGPDPAALLALCKRSRLYDRPALAEIRRQLEAGESYFLPALGAVFLASEQNFVVAEEAAHFLRHASGGSPQGPARADLFYQLTMHEALGFLGSRLIAPDRETPCEAEILAIGLFPGDDDGEYGEDELHAYEIAALHLQAEREEEHAPFLKDVYDAPIPAFVGAAHLLGYSLADELHRAMDRKEITLEEIRALYFEDWAPEGAALRSYIGLRARVGLSPDALALALEDYLD